MSSLLKLKPRWEKTHSTQTFLLMPAMFVKELSNFNQVPNNKEERGRPLAGPIKGRTQEESGAEEDMENEQVCTD